MNFITAKEIQLCIQENRLYFLVEKLTGFFESLNSMSSCDLIEIMNGISYIFSSIQISNITDNIIELIILITICFKILRNICALGQEFQNKISEIPCLYEVVKQVLLLQSELINTCIQTDAQIVTLKKFSLQCIANLCVGNCETQQKTWINLKDQLIEDIQSVKSHCDISAMILYNMFIANNNFILEESKRIYKPLITIISSVPVSEQYDFVNIFLEYFLIKYEFFVDIYKTLEPDERLGTIYYALEIVKQDDKNKRINAELLKQFISDFKLKSDTILKSVSMYVESIEPQEVIVLLELIASATSQNSYSWLFSNDASLFLNIGCLLRSVNECGEQSNNIFTPLQKLEHLAPNSDAGSLIETEVSYQFKSLLVRSIGNLCYKNKKIQDLAREMDIILAVLNCTNVDARNPLIKEWSILAIHNLCENNIENQNIIAGLSKLHNHENNILTDLITKTGSLRIQPS